MSLSNVSLSNVPNHFLASLPTQDLALIEPYLKPFELVTGDVLYRAGDRVHRLYFPYSGVISIVVGFSSGQFVEAGMLGRNSSVGVGAALDGPIAINQAIVQVSGEASVAEASIVKRLAAQSEKLRLHLIRHEQAAAAQTQQVAGCNAVHTLEERLSRWLLQTRDLVRSDTLPLTQEFLSQMLGVQRSSVTQIARKLQNAGLITYRRGRINIMDLEGLRDSSCECYEAVSTHFGRLVGWFPDPNGPRQQGLDAE
jgi:CRP-like cAMP-binding protein